MSSVSKREPGSSEDILLLEDFFENGYNVLISRVRFAQCPGREPVIDVFSFQTDSEIQEALFVCKSPAHPTFLLTRLDTVDRTSPKKRSPKKPPRNDGVRRTADPSEKR